MSISVVLPDPDGPITPTYSPGAMARSTPLSACTSASPMAYVLVTPRKRTTAAIASLQLAFVALVDPVDDLHPVAAEDAGAHGAARQVGARRALDALDQHLVAVVQQRRFRHDQHRRMHVGDDVGVA